MGLIVLVLQSCHFFSQVYASVTWFLKNNKDLKMIYFGVPRVGKSIPIIETKINFIQILQTNKC
jgi:hypothetical protein